MEQIDNSSEARQRRMLAWQYVLPRVVEFESASPLEQGGRDDFIADLVRLDDYRTPPDDEPNTDALAA